MGKLKITLFALLALLGFCRAQAETVSPYLTDFNSNPGTGNHDFAVASNWKHIVPVSDYDGYGPYYMSYSYSSTDGIDGSGTLLAYRQYAGDYDGGEVVKDILVTPVVSGTVTLYVKASGLASTSNPSFVEFYNVNTEGTGLGSLIQRFTADSYVVSETVEGWSTVTINVSSPQRIGIRAQYVYLDNFSAASAEIVKERKLTISSVTSPTGSTPVICNQKEDGTADASVVVKMKNDGDEDLHVGDTDFTLSFVWRTYYGSTVTAYDDVTFAVPEDLAVGEEKTVTATFSLPAEVVSAIFTNMSSGYFYLKVKENVSGSISSAMLQSKLAAYESKFIFDMEGTSYYSSSSATTTPIDFGKISESTTLNYEIYNPGNAQLTINSITLPAPFTTDSPATPFTVTAGEKKVIAITMPYGEPGIFSGNLVINYTNFGKEAADYTLGISGTIIDTSKNWITFSNAANTNGQFPEGSIHSDQVYISKQSVADQDNYYLQSTGTVTKFITPLLTAEAGESFTFDGWYSSYNSNAAITVYISTDRVSWTQIAKVTYATGNAGLGSTAKAFTATIAEAGDYYLAFELAGNALLDNIYGLTLAPTPEHDWYITEEADIPSTGKQNYDYTATIKVQNISAAADEIETATLYMNGKAVVTIEGTALAANTKTAAEGTGRNGYCNIESPTTIAFTFKPHEFGSFPTYIELKSGDKVITTEEVNVVIAEEVAESDISPVADRTSSYVPFYMLWMDTTGGSFCDFYYIPEQLKAYGLKAGDIITAITFTGTLSSQKTINSMTAKAWVGMEAESDYAKGSPDKDNMTEYTIYEEESVTFVSGDNEFKIDLTNQPLTWDGTSIIRIFTHTDGHGSYVGGMNFGTDSNYSNAYYGYGTNPLWNNTNTPVASFSLSLVPTTLSGVVLDEQEQPIEGATVTLYNETDDVQYQGTTDADGNYSINVVQNLLTYVATATAEGYEESASEELDFTNGSLTQDFVLTEAMPESVTITLTADGTSYSGKWALDFSGLDIMPFKATKKNPKTIHVESVTIVPDHTGVIIKGEPGVYEVPTTTESTTDDFADNLMVANVDGPYLVTAADEGYVYRYVNNNGEAMFQKAKAGQTVSVGKAYLRLTEASALDFLGFEDDTTTGISQVETTGDDRAPMYNLGGQRVNGSYRGVVIQNGKKVIK